MRLIIPVFEYIAVRDERYAATGKVEADTFLSAREKLLEEHYNGDGLQFESYAGGQGPDQFILTDPDGQEFELNDDQPQPEPASPALLSALQDVVRWVEATSCREAFQRSAAFATAKAAIENAAFPAEMTSDPSLQS